jgi:hypothetical protein
MVVSHTGGVVGSCGDYGGVVVRCEPKYKKFLVSINKQEEKKTYLGPKRRVWRRLGPFLSSPRNLTLVVLVVVRRGGGRW